MQRRAVIIGGLVLLLLVAGVWLYKRSSGGEAESRPEQPAAAPTAPVRAGAEGGEQRGERGPMVVLQDDDPEGSLRLEGQVIDATDQPVAGAVVTLGSNPPRATESAEDGSFFFDELVARPYTLVARHQGGAAGPVTARLTESSDPVILRLRPAAAVEVTVVDAETQQPVTGATVELRDLDVLTATTGADGVARITGVVPGWYTLVGYGPAYAKQHDWLRVPAGATTQQARLELRGGAKVSGRVLDPDGAPIPGARVLYSGASEWSQQADPRHDAAVTDGEGRWSFQALPAGSFRFVARHDTHAPGSSELVTLDGTAEKAGVDIQLDPGAVLTGRVTDDQGAAVPSARVRVVASGRGFSRPRQTFTGEDGRFRMEGLPRRSVDAVALAEAGSSQIAEVDLSKGTGTAEIELVLDLTGTIAGVVESPDGEPIEGAQVTAMPDVRRGGPDFERSAFRLRGFPEELTDAGGRFVLRGLEPGEYQVSASPPGSARRGGFGFRRGGRDGVEAVVGDQDVRIVLEPDGGIEGRVAFADGKVPEIFTVSAGMGMGGGTPFAGGDGHFVLDQLAPGDYSVQIRGAGFDPRRLDDVKVEPGAITDIGEIVVAQGRRIAGRVVDTSGQPVAGATVRGGSMLFGDGSSTASRMGAGPMTASAKETATDEAGAFVLSGVGNGDRTLVAEHDTRGRSRAMLVPGGPDPVRNLELVIEPFGALEGTVTQNGQPVPSVRISVQSQTAPAVIFGVATGDDGAFRFDRLAPDVYKASVVDGMPMRGMGFHSKTVTVQSGQTATVELSIEGGEVTLAATPVPQNTDSLGFAMMHLVQGSLEAPASARELDLAIAARPGYSSFAFSMGGQPARFESLAPGDYTVCAVPYPLLGNPSEYMAYGEDHGDALPVYCQSVKLAAEPAEQAIEIPVQVPDKAGSDGTEG